MRRAVSEVVFVPACHTPKTTRARNYDVNDVRHLYVQVRKLPTFTTAGLAEFRARLDILDGIDEAQLAPP